jgi:hypothetical protein
MGHLGRKKLQGYKAAQARVLSLVHHTHSTAAESLEDAVMGDGLVDEGVGMRHSVVILGAELRLSQRNGLVGEPQADTRNQPQLRWNLCDPRHASGVSPSHRTVGAQFGAHLNNKP